MLERVVTVVNELGLHARAAAQLVRKAKEFKSAVSITREDQAGSANAKSILSVLQVAATKGVKLTIVADGDDEREALQALAMMFESGFGEMDYDIDG